MLAVAFEAGVLLEGGRELLDVEGWPPFESKECSDFLFFGDGAGSSLGTHSIINRVQRSHGNFLSHPVLRLTQDTHGRPSGCSASVIALLRLEGTVGFLDDCAGADLEVAREDVDAL